MKLGRWLRIAVVVRRYERWRREGEAYLEQWATHLAVGSLLALSLVLPGKMGSELAMADDVSSDSSAAKLVEGLSRAYNKGEFEALEALLEKDVKTHGVAADGHTRDLPASIRELRDAFANLQWKAEVVVADKDRIAVLQRVTGVHQGPFLGIAPTRAPTALSFVDIFRMKEDRVTERWAMADRLDLIRFLTNPGPAKATLLAAPAREVAAFAAGQFLESVLVEEKGSLLVTHLFTNRISRITPAGEASVFAELDLGQPVEPLNLDFSKPVARAGVVCIAAAKDGSIYATVFSPKPEFHGVWRITPEGKGSPYAPLPGAFLNGIALDDFGNIHVADSDGKLWRLPAGKREAEVWLEHPLIARRSFVGFLPGANGIQIRKDTVYVTNSDTGNVIRIRIQPDRSAGKPEVYATGICGDDFAIDADENLYVTTHAFNSVIRVGRDGSRAVIAGPEQGVVGPASAAFGRLPGDEDSLYVVTDGGLFAPIPGVEIRPRVVQLKIGTKGR
ncbi:MAG: ester cyclase [Deltaproteobacteria bacterium]|nr:ester cyclase [Deltaproteobacteria bacterium]